MVFWMINDTFYFQLLTATDITEGGQHMIMCGIDKIKCQITIYVPFHTTDSQVKHVSMIFTECFELKGQCSYL